MLTGDLRDNAVIRPLIDEARQEGFEGGRQEGRRRVVLILLAEKFGVVPAWAAQRVQSATSDQLNQWALRVLHDTTVEDVLR
jgi:predicted transposase YdaD